MYQAPEIEHLENAVDAVREGLLPQKAKEPNRQLEAEDENAEAAEDDSHE